MVIRRAHYIFIALLSTFAAAASDEKRAEPVFAPVSETASSLTPHLSSSADGLYLSWLEVEGEGHVLRVSRWDGERFGTAHTVHTSERFFANWADFPSVVPLDSGRLVSHWLEKSAVGTYEYDVWTSHSDDDGASWSTPVRPHRDGTLSEHGFVSIVDRGSGTFGAVWLDGREMVDPDRPREMTLRFAQHDGASFGEEVLLDGRVCECCQTAMAATADGLIVLYRDRSNDEIRDVSTTRLVDGAWTEPSPLHVDGWHLTGCPVNGPQVAASGDAVAAAWFTGADDDPRVQVVFSEDGGASFGEPLRVDGGAPMGRVDILWGPDGDAVVSWSEKVDGREGEVRLRSVSPRGALGPPLSVARTGSSRASGFPRMARYGDDVFVAVTSSYDRKGPSRVEVKKVSDAVALIDEPAIGFSATAVDGSTFELSELSGRVVLLNFWGIWCTSCRDEIPELVALDREYRDAGLLVLGADYGDEPKDLPGFMESQGMTYPVLVDEGLAEDYDVIVFPTTVVIGRDGRLRYRTKGYTKKGFRALREAVSQLIEES